MSGKGPDFGISGKLIVGEGLSDSHFFESLCSKREISKFQYSHAGYHNPTGQPAGWEKFGLFLETLPSLPKFELLTDIVIFFDAGDDAAARLKAVQEQVEAVSVAGPEGEVKYAVSKPNAPTKVGKPRLHLFMVPQLDGSGGLESLCLAAAAEIMRDEAKSIMQAVDEFADRVCKTKDANGKGWTTEKRDKLRLQALISASWPKKPDLHFSQLFNLGGDKMIPLNSKAFDEIAVFLSAIAAL